MERRRRLYLLTPLLFATAVEARVFMTQQQALASAFPAGAKITRQTFFLTKEQSASIGVKEQLVIRYVGELDRKVVGYAYFDTHVVRTLPETVMIDPEVTGQVYPRAMVPPVPAGKRFEHRPTVRTG